MSEMVIEKRNGLASDWLSNRPRAVVRSSHTLFIGRLPPSLTLGNGDGAIDSILEAVACSWSPSRNNERSHDRTACKVRRSQWIDATLAWSLLAGVSKPKVFLGR